MASLARDSVPALLALSPPTSPRSVTPVHNEPLGSSFSYEYMQCRIFSAKIQMSLLIAK